jgi:WYL domain
MQKNKQQQRVHILRSILQARGQQGITLNDLIEALNERLESEGHARVGRRSVESTLAAMRTDLRMDIPVRIVQGEHRYAWEGMLDDSPYYPTDEDRETLPILFSTLNTQAELSALIWLKDRLTEDYGFTDEEMENSDYYTSANAEVYELDKVLKLCGRLIACMRRGQLVTFTYKKTDQNKPEKQHTVAPVHIRMYENRYYLYALLRGSDGSLKPKMTLFAIDQIRKHELTVVPPEEGEFDHALAMKQVQLKNYFKHVIGVWKPEDQEPENVRLRLTGVAKSYVKHRKLHPTQRMIHTDDASVTVEITVYVTEELDYLLGRFRGMCERV